MRFTKYNSYLMFRISSAGSASRMLQMPSLWSLCGQRHASGRLNVVYPERAVVTCNGKFVSLLIACCMVGAPGKLEDGLR